MEIQGELFEAFLESRGLQLGASTLTSERRYLRLFREFCDRVQLRSLHNLSKRHIEVYHHQLLAYPGRDQKQSSTSFQEKALQTVRQLLRWAARERQLLTPVEFELPRRADKLPRVPSVLEIQRLFSVVDISTPVGMRDLLQVELLYGLGLRLCECHRLDIDHLDLVQKTATIRGKGGHQRKLPLGATLLKCCREYLKSGRLQLGPNPGEEALFIASKTGARLGKHSLFLRVKNLAAKANLELTPHQLRHACATHMLAAGAELRHLQEYLGHVRITATQRYTRVCPEDLHQEFRRCHPRAQLR